MKITKNVLKQIIKEELSRIEEADQKNDSLQGRYGSNKLNKTVLILTFHGLRNYHGIIVDKVIPVPESSAVDVTFKTPEDKQKFEQIAAELEIDKTF